MEDKYNLLPLSEETLRYMVEDLMTALETTETLRDRFAMAVMTGLLAYSHVNPTIGNYHENCKASQAAEAAYWYADAMMEHRKK